MEQSKKVRFLLFKYYNMLEFIHSQNLSHSNSQFKCFLRSWFKFNIKPRVSMNQALTDLSRNLANRV